MRRRTSVSLVAALLPLTLLAACSSGGTGTAAPTPSPSASVSSAAPAPAAPRVGSCHSLTLREAVDPVDAGSPVGCRRPHTSVTVKVGRISAARRRPPARGRLPHRAGPADRRPAPARSPTPSAVTGPPGA